MMFAMFLSIAASTATPTPSSDWTIVAETDSGVMAIDPQTVIADGARRSVWTRASTIGEDGLATTMVVLAEVDCGARTWAKRRLIALDENGDAREEPQLDGSTLPVAPGTPSQMIFDKVCG